MDQTDEARAKRARPAKRVRVQSPHKAKKTVVKQIDSERLNAKRAVDTICNSAT